MKKILRKLSVIIGILILVLGVSLSSRLGRSDDSIPSNNTQPAEALKNFVSHKIVKNESFGSLIQFTGKVVARQKIDLLTEVNGILLKSDKELREGIRFNRGDLILNLDDSDLKIDIQAAKSQFFSAIVNILPDIENDHPTNLQAWKNYTDQFSIDASIAPLPQAKTKREQLFIGGKNLLNQYYNIKKMEHQLTKYQVYAPFDCVLSISSIYEGAYVRNGQKLGVLSHPNRYEVEANISLYDEDFFKVGSKVLLNSQVNNNTWKGTVIRFGKSIDESTQSKKVFIAVNSEALNEGMFLNGQIESGKINNVCKIQRKLLLNNNQLFSIESDSLKLLDVEVVKVEQNDMFVKGLPDGSMILNQNLTGAYEGMPVELIK